MARRTRLQFSGAVYHVMSRGNRKAAVFEDDHDRHLFLETLGDATVRYGIRTYAGCLMSNHYHFVFDTPRGNLADAMRHINGVYAQAFNRRHGLTGHVFEARFRSLVVQRESYLRRVVRYVVLNPMRAHLTANIADWPWSTYRATVGIDAAPDWLYLDWLDWAFEANDRLDAQRKYQVYVNEPTARTVTIDTKALAIGSEAFRQSLGVTPTGPIDRTLPYTSVLPARPALAALFADEHSWATDRKLRIEVAHVTHGYRQAEIARHLGLDPSSVSKALWRLRTARPKPASTR